MKQLPSVITGCIVCPYLMRGFNGNFGCELTGGYLSVVTNDKKKIPQDHINPNCPLPEYEPKEIHEYNPT